MWKLIKYLFLLIFFCGTAMVGGAYYYMQRPLALPSSPLSFDIASGSSLTAVARQLSQAGVIGEPMLFVALGRVMGEASNIKAGNYELEGPLTPLDLMKKITRGDYTLVTVRFVEGWTFKQMRAALNEHAGVRHDTQALPDAEIARRLEIPGSAPEGWFFPDTYHFSRGASDLAILRRAHRLMQTQLVAQWQKRSSSVPLASPYEALILASIIEKETGKSGDRTMVAAVFVNRLRIGMRLQTDPTVIYGMGETFDGNLRRRDLQEDTPWNTYTRSGLPPTPIAMPGLASIEAALNPAADKRVLYFVARGDGSSHFSQTLDEHNNAVTKYQRSGRRQ